MALPDLTGLNIQDTYKRVLHRDEDGNIYDGTGSLFIPKSASYEINHELSSSFAETASFAASALPNTTFIAKNISASHNIQANNVFGNSIASTGHITASENISASGNIYGSDYYSNNRFVYTYDGTRIKIGDSTPVLIQGNLTASGLISASGDEGINILGSDLWVYGRIRTIGSEVSIESGSISLSGDISGSDTSTGSFAHIITSTGSIEFREGREKVGALKFSETDGLEIRNKADDGRQKIKVSTLDAEEVVVNNTLHYSGSLNTSGLISTGTISASGNIIGNNVIGVMNGGTF